YSFFFQAEDGIRDLTVTGVQTCALPIYPGRMVDVISLSLGYFDETPHDATFTSGLWNVIELLLGQGVLVVAAAGNYSTSRRFYRSEERRVGKECGSRWAAEA